MSWNKCGERDDRAIRPSPDLQIFEEELYLGLLQIRPHTTQEWGLHVTPSPRPEFFLTTPSQVYFGLIEHSPCILQHPSASAGRCKSFNRIKWLLSSSRRSYWRKFTPNGECENSRVIRLSVFVLHPSRVYHLTISVRSFTLLYRAAWFLFRFAMR